MTKTPISFNAYETQLESGINLIEASAGTGKTFSIAMLVLRFLLEKGYSIDQLLVVTFTNAAAQELRDRIRSRIVEVKDILSGKLSKDEVFNAWAGNLPDPGKAKLQLVTALAEMDSAHIFTIHGFCQRILSQHALESGQIFGSELLDNVSAIKQQIAEDYWRIQTYSRSIQQVLLLRNGSTSPAHLAKSIDRLRDGSTILPQAKDLDVCLQNIEAQIADIRQQLPTIVEAVANCISSNSDKFKPAYLDDFPHARKAIEDYLADANKPMPVSAVLALSQDYLFTTALNGNKFRKTKAQTAEERKQQFLDENGINTRSIDPLSQELAELKVSFQLGLFAYQQQELEARLKHSNLMSYDDMITRLARALNEEGSAIIQRLLQDKFPVALIDEFQDTDDAQWSIFSALPKKAGNYLYLIGDPKQAIYKFRGADIYSYLAAQQQAQREYNLDTNWRSQQSLVSAVNALFDVESPFLVEKIGYYPVKAANHMSEFSAHGQALEQLVLWELEDNPSHKDGFWLSNNGNPKEHIRYHTVNEILRQLDPASGATIKGKALRPRDFAILVRSNSEAATYQQILMQHGLPSVLNSKSSVFESDQALEVYHLLHAISRPGNASLLIYALCQPWFGKSGNDIHQLEQNLDDWLICFQEYHELWQTKGLLAMMQSLMEKEKVVSHLVEYADVERRLTNINHILELIQQAVIEHRLSVVKTLEWLELAIEEKLAGDGKELRLESDEDTINIVTIHSSKGLEYPIVFCPDLWVQKSNRSSSVLVFHKGEEQVCDLGSEYFDEHKALEQFEDQAEELRLLYVAVTRAKYRCYVAWANQRTVAEENKSALAYLLGQQSGETWGERMKSLLNAQPECFVYQKLEIDPTISGRFQQSKTGDLNDFRIIEKQPQADWMMTSYSGLAYYSQHDADIPELPLDKSEEQERAGAEEIEVELPKGAHTGNLVHDLLEHTPFSTLSAELDNPAYMNRRGELIKRYGVEIENTEILDELLHNTVNTSLSVDDESFKLANLTDSQCLKEMPFYYAVEHLDTSRINRVLSHSDTVLPLSKNQMSGQLTGFVDLICEYQGRYYVMDYKTNYLAEYTEQSMTEAMREHNYGLQYWIYTLVLHRYLEQTLEGYRFEEHFGGVRYLFVRGMKADQAMSGVFQDQPDLATVEALSEAFSC